MEPRAACGGTQGLQGNLGARPRTALVSERVLNARSAMMRLSGTWPSATSALLRKVSAAEAAAIDNPPQVRRRSAEKPRQACRRSAPDRPRSAADPHRDQNPSYPAEGALPIVSAPCALLRRESAERAVVCAALSLLPRC